VGADPSERLTRRAGAGRIWRFYASWRRAAYVRERSQVIAESRSGKPSFAPFHQVSPIDQNP
jgi:hypothetical protein